MYLTVCCMTRSRGPQRYFKRAMLRRMSWIFVLRKPEGRRGKKSSVKNFLGRKRNCYGISIRSVRRALQHSNRARSQKKKSMKQLWETRISAACGEHGIGLSQFMTSLAESNIALNRKVLADIAIYEPRTFQSLCEFCKQRSSEVGLGAATLSAPSGVITRGML